MPRHKAKVRHCDNPRAELVTAIEKHLAEKGEISWPDAYKMAIRFCLHGNQVWAEFLALVESGRCELEVEFCPLIDHPLPVLVLKKPETQTAPRGREDFLARLRKAQAEVDMWIEEIASERNRALVDVADLKAKLHSKEAPSVR
jgi:hypothetical protein